MKKFSFKMEKILDLKRMKEKADQRVLGEKLQTLNQLQGKLSENESIKASFDQVYRDLKRNGTLEAMEFRRHINYQNILAGQIREVLQEIDEHNKTVDEAREALKKSHCQTQVFEKIREAHWSKYKKDLEREMNKEMNEVAIERYRRQQGEEGSVLNVLMAIGSVAFLFVLLLIGALFAMKSLTPQRWDVVMQVLKYRETTFKNPEVVDKLIVGKEDPYLLHFSEYQKLVDIKKKYDALIAEDVDDEKVITNKVLNKRKEILRRANESFFRSREDFKKDLDALTAKEEDLKKREESLAQKQADFERAVKTKKQKNFEKAQADILKSMNSMDAEDVAAMLTGGADYDTLSADKRTRGQIPAKVAYASKYITKMKPRLRASVMQALGPKWSLDINNYLESQVPVE